MIYLSRRITGLLLSLLLCGLATSLASADDTLMVVGVRAVAIAMPTGLTVELYNASKVPKTVESVVLEYALAGTRPTTCRAASKSVVLAPGAVTRVTIQPTASSRECLNTRRMVQHLDPHLTAGGSIQLRPADAITSDRPEQRQSSTDKTLRGQASGCTDCADVGEIILSVRAEKEIHSGRAHWIRSLAPPAPDKKVPDARSQSKN